MDIYYDLENKRRISAYACQNGTLKVALCTEKGTFFTSAKFIFVNNM